jgi:hypothetical protein
MICHPITLTPIRICPPLRTQVWHTKTAAACLEELETCATGLTTARAAEVMARVGPNALAEKPKPTFLERLWDQVYT